MTCELVGTERALFVAWGTPEVDDVERIIDDVRQRLNGTKGAIFYVTRVPSDAPAPDANVRRRLNQILPTLVEYCASYHVILEGDGFVAAMKRGVLLSLFQLTQKRGLFHVHPSVDAFRLKVPSEWRLEIKRLLELSEERDLLVGPVPNERKGHGSGAFAIRDVKTRDANKSHAS